MPDAHRNVYAVATANKQRGTRETIDICARAGGRRCYVFVHATLEDTLQTEGDSSGMVHPTMLPIIFARTVSLSKTVFQTLDEFTTFFPAVLRHYS